MTRQHTEVILSPAAQDKTYSLTLMWVTHFAGQGLAGDIGTGSGTELEKSIKQERKWSPGILKSMWNKLGN